MIDLAPGASDARAPRYVSHGPKPAVIFAKSVGSFVPKLTRAAFEKNGFSTVTLLTDWAEIVGAGIARAATPERLVWPRANARAPAGKSGQPRSGAILVLSVDPSRALEVEYGASQIVERINGYFGYRAVERLRLEQAAFVAPEAAAPYWRPPRPRPAPVALPAEIAGIADAALRDALSRLAASVLGGG